MSEAVRRHALGDLQEPEEISQVVAPGLPDRFPPLRSWPHHPTNLVALPTPRFGRDDALASVTRKFRDEDARPVTLTGPGGSGQTQLTLEIAAELLDVFPDGVFFVDLASLRDPTLVLPTIPAIWNMRKQPTEEPRDTLTAYLGAKRMLLALANCKQVIDAAPVQADSAHQSCFAATHER
jgi:hypothetical protein